MTEQSKIQNRKSKIEGDSAERAGASGQGDRLILNRWISSLTPPAT
jgi:hypothetical protein